ncbi:MAG: hypothetical protein ACR2PT_07655 [Endozoicomonas sp.]
MKKDCVRARKNRLDKSAAFLLLSLNCICLSSQADSTAVQPYSEASAYHYPERFPAKQEIKSLPYITTLNNSDNDTFAWVSEDESFCAALYYAGVLDSEINFYPAIILAYTFGSLAILGSTYLGAEFSIPFGLSIFSFMNVPAYLEYCQRQIVNNSQGIQFKDAETSRGKFVSETDNKYVLPVTYFQFEPLSTEPGAPFMVVPFGFGLKSPLPRCLTMVNNRTAPAIMNCAFVYDQDKNRKIAASQLWGMDTSGNLISANPAAHRQIGPVQSSLHLGVKYSLKEMETMTRKRLSKFHPETGNIHKQIEFVPHK